MHTDIAVFSFIFAVYEGANQRVPFATFLGAMAIACTFLVFMPKLEVFKVWGIEARLTKTLDRAEEILGKLSRLSQISARATYLQMAWGNRMGTPTAQVKQSVLDQIDAQLSDLKVPEAEQRSIKKPFERMVKLDFYFLFTGVLRQYSALQNTYLVSAVHADPNSTAAQAAMLRHGEFITAWSKKQNDLDPSIKLDRFSLEEVLNDYIPRKGEWLSDVELETFQRFKTEIVNLNAECEAKGGYTKVAAEYYDKYAHDNNIVRAEQLWKER